MDVPTKSADGPRGHFILGNMADFQKEPLAFFQMLARDYGDVARFRLGPYSALFISHPDHIQQMLVKDAKKYHKSQVIKLAMGKFISNGLVSSDGTFWQKQRQLIQPAFHYTRIQSYAAEMVKATERLMSEWGSSQEVEIEEAMMKVALNIVNKTLFDANVTDASAQQVHEAMRIFQDIVGNEVKSPSMLPDWIPTDHNRSRLKALKLLDSIILKIINERRASGEDRGDLLSMLLLSRFEDGSLMPDQQVRDEALTLFVAGHETTGTALTWTLYLLSQYPNQADKLREELDNVLAGRLPTLDDLSQLPYIEMVIKESMRLYPPAWMTSRMATEDTSIGDYAVKKGTMIFVSPYVTHHDPRWWELPDVFRPERFAAGWEEQVPRYAYFPFGGGPRVCIGNTFAMMEARLIIATLVQAFHFKFIPDQKVEMLPLATLRSKHGLKMDVTARSGWKMQSSVSENSQIVEAD